MFRPSDRECGFTAFVLRNVMHYPFKYSEKENHGNFVMSLMGFLHLVNKRL